MQRDLRPFGYLRSGIDDKFGPGTELAVKALKHDLLHSDGRSAGADGNAPVAVLDYNRGRVFDGDGEVDQALVECISDMLDDSAWPKLPAAENPVEENRKILRELVALRSGEVPIPFVLAILKQESSLQHFREPREGNEDAFIVVGLDTNAGEKHIITSRSRRDPSCPNEAGTAPLSPGRLDMYGLAWPPRVANR